MDDLVAFWRDLRLAVKQAHAIGAAFRIRGDEIEIGGIDRLPDKLRGALDPELLREYVGAAEDDDEAIEFLNRLGVEAVLVNTVAGAAAAQDELDAQEAASIGIDIETIARPEYVSRMPVKVNVDGSIGKNKKDKLDKVRRPPGTDPNQADIATLQLYAGGKRCFVFHGGALDWILASPWLSAQIFVAHNATFETAFLQHGGLNLRINCTLQAGGLVIGVGFKGEKRSLANVSKEVLGLEPAKALQTSDWGAPSLSWGQVCYAASDAILAYRLWPKLRSEIVSKKRTEAYRLQRGAIPAVASMETIGLLPDREEHARQSAAWADKLDNARREFRALTGDDPPTNDNQRRAWLERVLQNREMGSIAPLNATNAERGKKKVPPALVTHAFRPGQSGNPGGRTASFAECQRLAREASPDAMRRLIELMASPDERVALMAADKVLERAWGKPKEQDSAAGGRRFSEMPADERRREVECLIALGKEVIARETGRLASPPQVMEGEAERVHVLSSVE